ncbi:hypothetical protein CL176_00425 [Suicoccus acidiformans]|uniref:Uncharacterized protein n=1 Tax=Suicoccus acidiformans TaxID=2036206 RepID=A0A347WHQ8_9LACT|nr:sensor histidine kinase [Suicoccus acidiformans]AXY24615.1 hypothetical protein CL176_00425 [Suicoccus acidiformans]
MKFQKLQKYLLENKFINLLIVSLIHFATIILSVYNFKTYVTEHAYYSNRIGLLIISLLFMFAYLTFIISDEKESNLFYIGWLFVIIAVGTVFIISANPYGLVFVALLYWALFESTMHIVFRGKTEFMSKYNRFINILTVVVCVLCLMIPLEPPFLDNIFSLYLNYRIIMGASFLLVSLIYRKHIRTLLKQQRIELGILICLNLFDMLIVIFGTEFFPILDSPKFENISDVMYPTSIVLFLQARIVSGVFKRKFTAFQRRFQLALSLLGIGLFLVLIVVGAVVKWEAVEVFVVFNLLLWAFSFAVTIMRGLIESAIINDDFSLLKPINALELVVNSNDEKDEFSDFLHNEVLQDIVVIKNLNEFSDQVDVKDKIDKSADNLIRIIRNRLDKYSDGYSDRLSVRENYENLVYTVCDRLDSDKRIMFELVGNSNILLAPYDRLIYRILEELATNAVKYASKNDIEIIISIDNNLVEITASNSYSQNTISKSTKKGQSLLEAKVALLGGSFQVETINNKYNVLIELLIDKEVANEYFINR